MLDTTIATLGPCRYDTPLTSQSFVKDSERVLVDADPEKVRQAMQGGGAPDSFENAGPRSKIYFDPARTSAAIVTCGGLCPGLNNVIQSLVRTLYFHYGVKTIHGIRYGFEGLVESYGHPFLPLTPDVVRDLHTKGGTILGSSRGPQDPAVMVETLHKNNISLLFTVGGDGTLRGAAAIADEVKRRGLDIAVVGVPKTIDNDISWVYRSFGFTTAVSVATNAIHSAHAEASGARNGIGLVKVMGRDSGFIASYVALASNEVNYVFIPEASFRMEGPGGFLEDLKSRLEAKSHVVVLTAEGAGEQYVASTGEKDASGNLQHGDIGMFLKEKISSYLKSEKVSFTMKYIDPSYIIRSVPASAEDAVFCIMLAQNAVHGAMAGKTGMLVGIWNSYFTFVPLRLATEKRKKVDPGGYLWSMVKEATGQPNFI
ncbi:MAG: ATP-dependent 6-phosphofructokinase [Spirochaetia bacterium]|nr:ATP-dependent 6-phosphofructokinase [Spirochaetia bacterium]